MRSGSRQMLQKTDFQKNEPRRGIWQEPGGESAEQSRVGEELKCARQNKRVVKI